MTDQTKPLLPMPFDYCYEWDGPYGTRKFNSAYHNGRKPDRSVALYTEAQMRERDVMWQQRLDSAVREALAAQPQRSTLRLADDIVDSITELADGAVYPDLLAAVRQLASMAASTQSPAPSAEPVAWCALTPNGKIAFFDGKPMVMVGASGNECHPVPLGVIAPPAEPSKVVAWEYRHAINIARDSKDWDMGRWRLTYDLEEAKRHPSGQGDWPWFESRPLCYATHPKAEPAGVPESLDTLSLYKRLCDLVAEANAVDTVIGRPDVLLAKLTKLRDEVGAMTDTRLPASPAAPQDKEGA